MAGKRYINSINENIGGDTNGASIRFNTDVRKWQFSNDGSSYTDFGSGGGGGNSVSIIPTYNDMPASGASGMLAIVEDTETGIPYIYNDAWKPYYKGIIGTLFPLVSEFSTFGDCTFTRSQGFVKTTNSCIEKSSNLATNSGDDIITCSDITFDLSDIGKKLTTSLIHGVVFEIINVLDSHTIQINSWTGWCAIVVFDIAIYKQGILNGITRAIPNLSNTTIGTIVQQHITPIPTGNPYSVFSGICFKESVSGKIYSVMIGAKTGKQRIIRCQKWTNNTTVSSTVDYFVPSLGSDILLLKLQKYGIIIRGWFEIDGIFSGNYTDAFFQDSFFTSSPDLMGFCSYSEGTSNLVYFINYLVV
jgi:hypothetical protein